MLNMLSMFMMSCVFLVALVYCLYSMWFKSDFLRYIAHSRSCAFHRSAVVVSVSNCITFYRISWWLTPSCYLLDVPQDILEQLKRLKDGLDAVNRWKEEVIRLCLSCVRS